MQFRELTIPGAFEVTPVRHGDGRGEFLEWFRGDLLAEHTGRRFELRQANLSISRDRVARGIHFSDVPPGQAKYVTVLSGSGRDIVVDLRVGSDTFGRWDAVDLTACARSAVFMPEGIGHAFIATADDTSLAYLTTDTYRPEGDRTLTLFDPELALQLPYPRDELIVSEKDAEAPTLAQLRDRGLLPTLAACRTVEQEWAR